MKKSDKFTQEGIQLLKSMDRINQIQIRLELHKQLLKKEIKTLQQIGNSYDIEQDKEKKNRLEIEGNFSREMIEILIEECKSCEAELAGL